MLEQDLGLPVARQQKTNLTATSEEPSAISDDELDEEDVPTVVLYVIAGLLILSFSLYLLIGGGHSNLH